MKVSTWLDLSKTVEVDVSVEDIRLALVEAFCEANVGALSGTQAVMRAMNHIAVFLNAFSQDEIDRLTTVQRSTIFAFLDKQAKRFQVPGGCMRAAGHDGPCNGLPRPGCFSATPPQSSTEGVA